MLRPRPWIARRAGLCHGGQKPRRGGSSNFGEYPIPPNRSPTLRWGSPSMASPCRAVQRLASSRAMHHETYRLFLCRHCRTQVRICSCCDRGQSYCSDGCRLDARRQQVRRASSRYQRSIRGALGHAARQAEYRRRRREKVTHQGSPGPSMKANVGSVPSPMVAAMVPIASRPAPVVAHSLVSCAFCGHLCRPFARQDFIRRRPTRRDIRSGGFIR